MAIKTYNEPWSPSNINCDWKPEKLARYSFSTNIIDFNAVGTQIGYKQNSKQPVQDSAMNLTAYIKVSPNVYSYEVEEGVINGILFISFFTLNSSGSYQYTGYKGLNPLLRKGIFKIEAEGYIRLTIYKEAWEKCYLKTNTFLMTEKKDMTPLKIIDNKTGEKIYEDSHFEVYVKSEALIKNFVDCFNLDAFQRFPSESSYWYGIQNSLIFNVATKDYYGKKYKFEDFIGNHSYSVGDLITGTIYPGFGTSKYVCVKQHTSASNFHDDYFASFSKLTGNWVNINISGGSWLYINRNIKEKNYSQDLGFPYVGSLVFKNLWGCDMLDYLKTYVNEAYLAISYYDFFAKNLRMANSHYDKFFERGFFSDMASNNNPSEIEGFGVRLLRGENFRNDDILGDTILNDYFYWGERRHAVSSSWTSDTDTINKEYFDKNINKPFDHYYTFRPYQGIPFFKEKVFEDFSIELVLEKTDVFGNIFQRIVDLPILVTFTNNLIKCYFHDSSLPENMYSFEYLNSNAVNSFSYDHTEGHSGVILNIVVWCPNIQRLSVSSTISNPSRVDKIPTIKNMNGGDELYGQVGKLSWTLNELNVGETVRAVHILEYSDGENYDKFVFIQEITRNS